MATAFAPFLPRLLAALLAASALAAPQPARAETRACTVLDALPFNITVPGHYCLDRDFVQDFNSYAIAINADDVLLDCNDHELRAIRLDTTASGITSFSARRNVEVRNCELENFYVGIHFDGGADPGSVGNRVVGNTVLRSRSVAINVIGSNNLIEGNRIAQSSGNVNGVAYGIFLFSPAALGVGNIIRDNHISDIRPAPPGEGNVPEAIFFFNVRSTEVSGNVIAGQYANTNWGNYGIHGSQTSHNLVTGNVVLSPPPAPAPLDGGHWIGIYLSGTAAELETNVCTDNVVGHYNTNILGCVSSGNTEF